MASNSSNSDGGAPGPAAKSGFSMSFGGAAKSKLKKKKAVVVAVPGFAQEQQAKQLDLITSLTDGGFESTLQQKEEIKELVIPLIKQVQWRSDGGHASDGDEADDGKDSDKPAKKAKTLAEQHADRFGPETIAEDGADANPEAIPILMQNRVPGYDDAKDDKDKYKNDMMQRPEETSMDEYSVMPVTSFGLAMLKGMGYKEGGAIGGVNKSVAKPRVGIPRPKLLGIGAKPGINQLINGKKEKKYIKQSESRVKKDMVAATGPDGKARHMRDFDEELVERETVEIRAGARVVLTGGSYKGKLGTIESIKREKINVKLQLGSNVIAVREEYVKPLARAEYAKLTRQTGTASEGSSDHRRDERSDDRDRSRKRKMDSDRERDRDRDRDGDGGSSKHRSDRSGSSGQRSWLAPNIRVRVVNDRYKKGKYYNNKVRLVDVTRPGLCNCVTDQGKLLECLEEIDLETIVPRDVGTKVLIVRGKLKGRRARLMERNKDRQRAIIQVMGEPEVEKVYFEDISEYVGPDDDEDY